MIERKETQGMKTDSGTIQMFRRDARAQPKCNEIEIRFPDGVGRGFSESPFDYENLPEHLLPYLQPLALERAQEYAGKNGRVTTLLDIIQARLLAPVQRATKEGFAWFGSFATTTGEYAGLSKRGNKTYVIAHGVGPLTNPERIRRAIKENEKEHLVTHNIQPHSLAAARLEPEEFYALLDQEDGKKVIVFDYLTIERLILGTNTDGVSSVESARNNVLVRAKLGERADDFLDKYMRNCSSKFYITYGCGGLGLKSGGRCTPLPDSVPYGCMLVTGSGYTIIGGATSDKLFVGIRQDEKKFSQK